MSWLGHLECGRCGARHEADLLQTVCRSCGGPLLARYAGLGQRRLDLAEVLRRRPGQLRLPELSPCSQGAATPTLGEGATPLVEVPRLASALGVGAFYVKDEAQNPAGSFKARGMAAAVARAAELGATALAVPSAGNAGAAAAAYAARHGLPVHVAIPDNTPRAVEEACRAAGAAVSRVPGSIAQAGHWLAQRAAREGWFNLATLREPYRVEGKKVMGYELLYDLGRLPDVIVYPTGGGTGLIGMAKAFDEMEALGWIDGARPRLVSVQAAGCAPIVRAFHDGEERARPWADPAPTAAYGLRVPAALGDFLMLQALRRSRGSALAVSEEEIAAGSSALARASGIWPCPEGGACYAALQRLAAQGWLRAGEQVVLFNTGSPFAYFY